jgi:hypothetical protein
MPVWLGIDFSGDHNMWSPGCNRSNVWIATLENHQSPLKYSIVDLQPVQKLPGTGSPFSRLVTKLHAGNFRAAGIDAPFSLPKSVQQNNHGTLLRLIGQIDCHGRPFPRAQDFLAEFKGVDLPWGRHEYRETESHWRKKGMNVRSTLWGGPRGGAPMTSACLTLLNQAGCSVWPFSTALDEPLLVEAFPAAQLKTWGLPHQKYNGSTPEAVLNREKILKELDARVEFGNYRNKMAGNADALDAVLAAFAAIAVTENQLPEDISGISAVEGWIAVHR